MPKDLSPWISLSKLIPLVTSSHDFGQTSSLNSRIIYPTGCPASLLRCLIGSLNLIQVQNWMSSWYYLLRSLSFLCFSKWQTFYQLLRPRKFWNHPWFLFLSHPTSFDHQVLLILYPESGVYFLPSLLPPLYLKPLSFLSLVLVLGSSFAYAWSSVMSTQYNNHIDPVKKVTPSHQGIFVLTWNKSLTASSKLPLFLCLYPLNIFAHFPLQSSSEFAFHHATFPFFHEHWPSVNYNR